MKNFFDTPEKISLLNLEARTWCGTPFAAHAAIKSAGADCVGLVAGIYLAQGVLKKYAPGQYALDGGNHLANSQVLAWFTGRPEFERRDPALKSYLPGDTLCFHLGRVEHHVGLMLPDGDFIHSLPTRYAIVSNLRESYYARRITAVFRPIQP